MEIDCVRLHSAPPAKEPPPKQGVASSSGDGAASAAKEESGGPRLPKALEVRPDDSEEDAARKKRKLNMFKRQVGQQRTPAFVRWRGAMYIPLRRLVCPPKQPQPPRVMLPNATVCVKTPRRRRRRRRRSTVMTAVTHGSPSQGAIRLCRRQKMDMTPIGIRHEITARRRRV